MEDNEVYKIFKKTYLSDVIFKQHFDSMNMINIVAVTLQTITLLLGVLLKVIFNINCTWMVVATTTILIMEIVSTKILERNWKKAVKRLKTYENITEKLDPIMEKTEQGAE